MGKDNELKITPTINDKVIQAYKTCPMTVILVTRERESACSSIYSPLNHFEKIRGTEVVGIECAYKIRQGFLESRCVFDWSDLQCPLINSDFVKKSTNNNSGAENMRRFGREFRSDNKK